VKWEEGGGGEVGRWTNPSTFFCEHYENISDWICMNHVGIRPLTSEYAEFRNNMPLKFYKHQFYPLDLKVLSPKFLSFFF
jgi:hypothetical protein